MKNVCGYEGLIMTEEINWQYELEGYIRQGEPGKVEKAGAWQTAIGLQAVDGLKTSEYLIDTAKKHIEGEISIDQAHGRIRDYYDNRSIRTEIENQTMEADIVSVRIAKILGEQVFQFSPVEYISIHKRLFEGVFDHAGKIRTYNISKKEWILNGDTVIYAPFDNINATLDYDFSMEKQFLYEGLSIEAAVKHLSKFTSDIWQIHPFYEGNTRSTAVFIIKYLKTFGFQIDNAIFENNSWYFRNALVRANYTNIQKGIFSTTKYLEMFFSNLLLKTNYELKNRQMHIEYDGSEDSDNVVEVQNDGLKKLDCSLGEIAVLEMIIENPHMMQEELAEYIGKSLSTVKRCGTSLQKKGYIRRVNGKRYGYWEVLI